MKELISNIQYKAFSLLLDVSNTGIEELDGPINKGWNVFMGLIRAGGAFWAVYGIAKLALSAHDQDTHGKKAGFIGIIGGAALFAAGSIVSYLMGIS